ncbi:dynamin family protein [Dactylosporangium sp. NPDC005555]|uniref:dynamin family protein n=1 Tax=Dactylosporangium sp. NPDC005555 TaxID=3154889 RepID=UPI0033B62CE6
MGSGIMQAPLIDLTVTTPGGPVSAMPVRGSRSHRQPEPRSASGARSYAVIAGSPRSGKTALLNALIRRAEPAPAGDAWLVFRHGEKPETRAFVPGHREPRTVIGAFVPTRRDPRPGPSRPARRIEITHPASLLKRVALVDTPGSGGLDAANAEIILDAAERGLGLLFVVDAAAPLPRADLDLLAAAADRVDRIAFVLTRIDQHDAWPEMLVANRALLASRGQRLAAAPWFPVSLDPEAVFGVAELRHELETWAEARPAPAGVAAATVSGAGDEWQEILEREIANRRVAAVQRVSIDLATIHVRCVQELGSGKGCPELPHVLDRELHALSVRTTRQLCADTREVIGAVFAELLDAAPDAVVLARVAAAARRTVDSLRDDDRDRDHALLLTATSAVATVAGATAVDNLSAVGGAEPADQVLPSLGIALNASCYALWQPKVAPGGPPKPADKKDCRRWLQHALREIEVEVGHELGERYAGLRQALTIIGGDAVDHGVLLA